MNILGPILARIFCNSCCYCQNFRSSEHSLDEAGVLDMSLLLNLCTERPFVMSASTKSRTHS